MRVRVGGYAWFQKDDLSVVQRQTLRARLTLHPRKVGDHPGDPPGPLPLYKETENEFGIPREFYLHWRKPDHEVAMEVTEGDKSRWPGDLHFAEKLRLEQQAALAHTLATFHGGKLGGIVRASPGWGKTVFGCALVAALQVPTLVIVHKEFLLNQWRERIEQFLPGALVGIVQAERFEWGNVHVAIGMVHTLAGKELPECFYRWPGLVITDEVHRIGAETWSPVPPMFPSRYRLGLSATPRRKDRADQAFFWHIGPLIFAAKEKRMTPRVRRVWTRFHLIKTPTFNPDLVSKNLVLRFLCANALRNELIVDQINLAARAGRKCLVLSERLQHLQDLEITMRARWPADAGPQPSMGRYVGGITEEEREVAGQARVIFATSQFVQEGLDIPALDTIFLTTPLADVEQAVGRILRPYEGKKEPIVVDFRDDEVGLCKRLGELRDEFYTRLAS